MNRFFLQILILNGCFLFFGIACQQKKTNNEQEIVKSIVQKVLKAKASNTLIEPFSKTYKNLSLNQAYLIQQNLSKELSKLYGPIAGYKLGYSDSSALRKNNMSSPAYGPIFKNQIHKSGASFLTSDFRNFSIENEIVFTIAKDIIKPIASTKELVRYVKSVHLGFDLSGNIFRDQTNIIDFVASGAGSKYFVVGEGRDPAKTNLANITLSIMLGDRVRYRGVSNNVLGNPWYALQAVANDLLKRGYHLKSGDLIFSGKVAPAYNAPSEQAKGLYTGTANMFSDIEVLVK